MVFAAISVQNSIKYYKVSYAVAPFSMPDWTMHLIS